ncbi:MAG: hypothetical protein PHX72_00305 [Candidatus Shapirobacteria bacterium]|nr:hypothetical protein [Candidatus Shapirobacteria bacterium]
MNKNTIIAIAALVLLVVAGFLVFNQSSVQAPETVDIGEAQLPEDTVTLEEAEVPQTVVEEFLTNLVKSAPPESDEIAYETAVSLLSQDAKTLATDEEGDIVLPLLVGIQDLPDMGYQVISVEYQDDLVTNEEDSLALVTVEMRYSGGDIERVFALSLADGQWLIDRVTQE